MPQGFIGKASRRYLLTVGDAMSSAHAVHNRDPFGGQSHRIKISGRSNHSAPHSTDSAESGGYSTGIGNSSNVVVDGNTYDEILQRIRMIDAETAESMYNIAVQIEEMCQSIYIVPSTLPKYLAIVDKVKASLGEFQSLTDEARSFANGFVEEVTHIDGQ